MHSRTASLACSPTTVSVSEGAHGWQAQGEALTMLQSFDDWFGAKLPSWAAEKFGLVSPVPGKPQVL